MNFNELISELQERNRERVNEPPFISSNEKFHYVVTPERLYQLTQQTAEAVRDWCVDNMPKEKPLVHDVNWAEGYNACRRTILTQLQAN